mmetsp:Transcript_6470/g.8181  ORF Transcript_6470/g.8181 Transcript_6470/m.8181 type:complete len:87 (-) Transcript_6470:359-619(-)
MFTIKDNTIWFKQANYINQNGKDYTLDVKKCSKIEHEHPKGQIKKMIHKVYVCTIGISNPTPNVTNKKHYSVAHYLTACVLSRLYR